MTRQLSLFAGGDYYVAYGDDAKVMGEVLTLVVTRSHDGHAISFFPRYRLHEYTAKFNDRGISVAVIEAT